MAGNKNFSQTIQYKGQLDVSQIVSSLQKIRNELANSSTLKGKDSLFINVDKEMKNIENLSTQLKAAIQKGFSNPKDVKDFERIVNSLDKSFNKVAVDLNGINASKLTQELRNATDELTQQKKALNDIIASEKNNISLQMQSIKHGRTYANTLVQSAKSGEKLEEVQKRITNEIDQQIEKQKQLKAQAEQKVSTATTQLNVAKTNAYKTSFRQSSFKTIDESGKKTTTTISDEQYSKVNQIFKEVVSNEKTAEKAIEKFNKELQKLGISASKAAINNVSKSFNEIQTSVKPAEAALKTAEAELQKVKKALNQMTQQKGTVGSVINSQEIVSSYQKIVAAVNSVAQAENNVNAARGKMGSQIPEMQRYATLMNQYKGATQQATQQVGELTEQQQRFDSTFDHLTRYIQYTFSLANGFRMLRQVVQKTFNDIQSLDKSFASIAMVTDYSVEEMWSSYDDYAEMANRLGQSTKDVIASSALFYQQGLDTAESLELTESTMKLATLAGSDFETATSQMTAALRGFNMEMSEGERITDVYSELAAKAAADVDGIAYAMSKTASIAASAGMEFETTSAFLTQMIETTQEAPENIGTAMKTIIARFTELKENVAGTADSEFEDLDYNKVDTALKSVGVSLKDTNGQFRDLDDVFLELAEKWNTLDRNSQRYIATIAAGSRQQSRFIAMMENYDRTLELVDTAYNSAGKSSEQFAKYQDTVEYKTKQLSNTWEQLRTGFLDSDTYKNAIDMLNNLLTKINEFNGIDFIKLGSIWLIFGKTAIEKFIKGMQSSINGIRGVFNKALSSIDQTVISKLAKTNLGKKIGINIPLNITSEQAEAEITQLKLKIEELKSNNKIFLDLNDEQINSELQRIELEIKKVQAEAQRMMSLDIAQNRNPQSMNYYTKEAYKNLGYNAGEHQSANEYKNYNNRIKQLENDQTSKQAAQLRGQAVGQAFSIGLTTSITSYMTANNPMDIFKYTMITTLTSAIPAIVGVFTNMGLSASAAFTATGIGAIIVGIGVLIGGVAAGVKAFSEYTEKQAKKQAAANDEYYEAVQELERLENIQEELNKTLDEANKKYDETKEELDTLVKLQDEYADYANKIALATEEKEEFLEINNEIAEQYPELISYYDEEGNAILTKIGGAWDEVINKKEEYFKIAAEEQAQAEVEANVGNLLIAQTELQKETGFSKNIESDFIKFLSGITNANRAGADTYWKWDPEKKNVYYNYSSGQPIYATEANYGKEGRAGSSGTQLTMVGILSGLNKSEKELYGALFKEIDARNEAIDLGIKNLESGDVIDKIIDQLESGEREDEQEYLKKFKDAIAQTSDINLNSYIKQVEQAEQALDESLGGLVEARIATLDEYTDASKNTQVLMHNFLTKDYGLTYEDLMTQFYEAASKEEYIDESWFDENGKLLSSAPLEKVTSALQTYVQDYSDKLGIDAQTLADKLNTTFNEQTRAYLDNFFNTIDKEGWSIVEQVKYINNSNLSQDIKDSFYEVNEALIEAYNNQMSYIAAIMGETPRKINENGTIEKGGAYQEKIATFSDTTQTQIYNLAQSGASEERMKEYINLISSDSFIQYEDIFGQIDLSKSYGELLANKDQYINLLHEQGVGIEQATKLVQDYIQKATLILGQGLTSKDQIGLLTAQWDQYIGEFSDKYSDLIDIQNEFLEEGEISIESYNKLVEAGLEEYVDYTSDGITLLKNDFEQLWTDAALQPVKELEQAINTEERLLQDWKDTSETFNNISVNADIYPDVNVRDFKNKGYDFTNVDDYVKYYKETGVLLDNLTDKQKEYIITIAENYDTEIELLNSRQEIISELNKKQPNTYIKSLRLLKEAAEQADEKVEDLKEDLEDLNKQLEEDKEALAEAEDELRQAIHGSDDFQSSLDGLVNYTEKIEQLDKAIEKTKEALEDVSDVDEAKGLMAQLNEQYDNKTISLGAENMAIDAALENLRSTLTENYGDYISFDEEGNPLIDFAYMTMDANDEIRKAFEEEYNLYNEYRDKQIDNLDAIAEIEKAKQEQREQALQNFVSIQEDVISILKEKAQEEIDVTKEKYDALEEADNDYLDALQDAIDKQRELRDKQNQYEDLATKEKKLSLLQRDTSGANQKEVLTLQNEIEDDRQNLLDSEIDSMIESMKELYEKQKEARDAEIEYMEEVTEDTQYFAEWASNIMSTWQSAEDMQAWYLENDPNAQDMTVEQTEVYLNETGDKYSDYVQYIATLATDFTTEQEELNAAMNEMYENTSTNVENIGTVTQDLAQAAADKIIEEATKARNDARDKLDETQNKIDETTGKLNAAEDTAVQKHSEAMQAMIDASQESMEEVSGYATKILADMLGVDLTDEKQAEKFATTYGFKDKNGKYSENFREAVEAAGGDKSKYKGTTKYKIMGHSGGNSSPFLIEKTYDSLEEAQAAAEKIKSEKKYAGVWVEGISSSTQYGKIDSNKVQNKYKIVTPADEVIADGFTSKQEALDYAKQKALEGNSKYNICYIRKYAQGGLVNYTGPAWVDGTKSRPEAFLNAEDTERIGNAAKILADIPLLNSTSLSENAISSNIGDTSIEIHINVESISSDYDVDQMIDRVKQEIVDVSKPTGTPVILKK